MICIGTQVPLIQRDILKRSQDALLMHRIPIGGVAVDGRDVVLSGGADSAITTARARLLVEEVSGVRSVRTKVFSGYRSSASSDAAGLSSHSESALLDAAANKQPKNVQNEIDRVLDSQSITFAPDSAVLTPESEVVLNKIAIYLAEAPNLACEIRGYDSHPWEARQNWVLALQRALSTEDYLESKGIAEWRLSTHAFQIGEGTEGRRTDRVVDLVVKAR